MAKSVNIRKTKQIKICIRFLFFIIIIVGYSSSLFLEMTVLINYADMLRQTNMRVCSLVCGPQVTYLSFLRKILKRLYVFNFQLFL